MFLHEPFPTITYYSIFKNRNLVILISNVILWIFYYGHILSVKTYLAEFWAAKDYLQIYLPWSWAWSSFWLLAVEYPFLYLQDLHRQFPLMKICFSAIAQQCQWRCGHPQKMDKARCFVWWLPFVVVLYSIHTWSIGILATFSVMVFIQTLWEIMFLGKKNIWKYCPLSFDFGLSINLLAAK